jgi:hypothetical protein
MNTQEYLTQKEYEFVVNHDAKAKDRLHYGDYYKYGEWLNLNVYSEYDKEVADFAMETGGGDLAHYMETGYLSPDDMYDSIEDEEGEKLKSQEDKFNKKYIRPHDLDMIDEDKITK